MNPSTDALKLALVTIVVLLGTIGTLVAVLITRTEGASRSRTWTAGAGSFAGVVTVVVTLFNSVGLF
jgi:hypothetical protein